MSEINTASPRIPSPLTAGMPLRQSTLTNTHAESSELPDHKLRLFTIQVTKSILFTFQSQEMLNSGIAYDLRHL